MNINKYKEIIIRDRSAFYGCSAETFLNPGTTFRPLESLNGKNTMYYTKFFEHTFISAGKEMISHLSDLSEKGKKSTEIKNLKRLFSKFKIENSFPHFIYPEDSVSACQLAEGYDIRAVDPADHPPHCRWG